MKIDKIKNAFTLAEVLITLGIIGIVAAMTIPVLMNNYQKTQYAVQLKKGYTQFSQALKQMAQDMGCSDDLECTGIFATPGYWQTTQNFGDQIVKYMRISSNCRVFAGCWAVKMNDNYDGSGGAPADDINPDTSLYKFITADGQAFAIWGQTNNCEAEFNWHYCGGMYIDVNGPQKGPNYLGRDMFLFKIMNTNGIRVIPWVGGGGADAQNSGYWNNTNCTPSNTAGLFCSGRVMNDGWQMNY